jgi:hypothetical protein
MSLSAEKVVAASNAWSWIPDNATTEATEEYLLVRFPDYFEHPLELLRFSPAEASGASPQAVDAVLDRACRFGLPDLHWWVRLDSPPGVADLLAARGATVGETLDVLAVDLSRGAPEILPPTRAVTLRWATDVSTLRDGTQVGVTVFGGSMPPHERLVEEAKRDSAAVAAGDGGMIVAYSGDRPVGSGGIAMAGGVARLWGGAVRQEARRQGVYRAILAARLRYGAAHGATMALVKGRLEPSAPILRQAGFAAYGQEVMYRVPLAQALAVVVAGGRERVVGVEGREFACGLFPVDLGLGVLVLGALPDVRLLGRDAGRQRVGGGRHLVGVEGVQPRVDALVLGHLVERVLVEALRSTTMLTTVPVKLRFAHTRHATANVFVQPAGLTSASGARGDDPRCGYDARQRVAPG